MTNDIDYEEIEVPDEKPPTEYTYNQRRAEILKLWKETADPWAELNQSELARRYDLSHTQINKDFQLIRQWIRENIGKRDTTKTTLGFDRAIKELEKQNKWFKAAKCRKLKWEWMHETGHMDKQADEHELKIKQEVVESE